MAASDLLALLLLALAGSAHCAGMCGGFALAAASPRVGRGLWLRLLVYHTAKSISYLFVAVVLLACLEQAWGRGWVENLQQGLGWLLALSLFVLGLAQVTRLRWQPAWQTRLSHRFGSCGPLALGRPSLLRAAIVGWLNGLLPCGLSLAALFLVLRFRALPEIALGVFIFGLGTLPVLAATVFFSSRLSPLRRGQLSTASGWLLLVLALITALRSTPAAAAWLHGHLGGLWGLPADPWCR